jgi:biopolymer transport protein ExbB
VKRKSNALDAVKRASARSASLVHADLKRGLNNLAGIAATARLLGLLGTVLSMAESWHGLGTEKRTIMRWIANWCAESLMPTAFGLLVALLAFCCYRYLSERLENLDLEMETASLELMNDLFHLQSTNI